jgi:hypothetical protein
MPIIRAVILDIVHGRLSGLNGETSTVAAARTGGEVYVLVP